MERKTAEKKNKILNSALIVLAEKGYHGTTMEDIANHLLMTKGSLYYYFKGKQDLVFQSQIRILKQSIENVKSVNQQELTSEEKLASVISKHIEYSLREKAGFLLMANPTEIFSETQLTEIYHLREAYAACYDELIEAGVKAGYFKVENIPVARNVLLGAMNWVTQWYSEEGALSIEAFAQLVTDYTMRIVRK